MAEYVPTFLPPSVYRHAVEEGLIAPDDGRFAVVQPLTEAGSRKARLLSSGARATFDRRGVRT